MSDHLRFPKMKESLTPQTLNPEHEYVIELRQMPVVGLGEHNYWVLRDNTTGQDIAEIHGAAFDKETGKHKAVGMPGDSLGFLQRRSFDGRLFEDQAPSLVTTTLEISGSAEEIERRWNNGLASARHFNEKGIGYELFGGSPESSAANSNGAAYSIGRAIGVAPEILENAPKGTWRMAPGWGRDLHQEYPEVPQPRMPHDGVRIEKLTPKQQPVPFPWEQGKVSDDALVGNAGDGALRVEADRLIGSEDYWRNADKQARTRSLFQEIERREKGDRDTATPPDFQNLPYVPGAEEKRLPARPARPRRAGRGDSRPARRRERRRVRVARRAQRRGPSGRSRRPDGRRRLLARPAQAAACSRDLPAALSRNPAHRAAQLRGRSLSATPPAPCRRGRGRRRRPSGRRSCGSRARRRSGSSNGCA